MILLSGILFSVSLIAILELADASREAVRLKKSLSKNK